MDAFTPELSQYWLETRDEGKFDAPRMDQVVEDEEALSELSDRVYAARCVI